MSLEKSLNYVKLNQAPLTREGYQEICDYDSVFRDRVVYMERKNLNAIFSNYSDVKIYAKNKREKLVEVPLSNVSFFYHARLKTIYYQLSGSDLKHTRGHIDAKNKRFMNKKEEVSIEVLSSKEASEKIQSAFSLVKKRLVSITGSSGGSDLSVLDADVNFFDKNKLITKIIEFFGAGSL